MPTVQRKVKFATAGSLGGLGLGKALTGALVSFNLLTPEQADAVDPLVDFLFTGLGTFFGGYFPTAN